MALQRSLDTMQGRFVGRGDLSGDQLGAKRSRHADLRATVKVRTSPLLHRYRSPHLSDLRDTLLFSPQEFSLCINLSSLQLFVRLMLCAFRSQSTFPPPLTTEMLPLHPTSFAQGYATFSPMTWTVCKWLQFLLPEGKRYTMPAVPPGFSLELGSVANGMEQLLQETGKGAQGSRELRRSQQKK